jgi:cbb3-type cytochrome oxidase subunit 3
MTTEALSYLIFGIFLVALFLWIIVHYYSKKRHEKIEAPKYKIFDDDDDDDDNNDKV